MKLRCFSDRLCSVVRSSIPCLATLMAISLVPGAIFAESGTLRWAKPKSKGVVTAHLVVPSTPELGDGRIDGIVQVQHVQGQPVTPPRIPAPSPKAMTDAQRDTIFKELRPQSTTPPAGATLVPSTSSTSTPSALSSPVKPRETYVPKKDAVDAVIDAVVTSPNLPKTEAVSIDKKDPSLSDKTINLFSTDVPKAPQPTFGGYATPKSKEIECPKNADSKSIREISFDIRPMPGPLPKECPMNATPYTGRHFGQTCYQWKAAALCTKGAYFEDVQLERYGHSICPTLEPVISGARFFLTIPFLPYKMGLTPPNECVYTLGHYRAGNCAPYMLDPLPISVRALLFEGAAIGGAVAFIP